MFRSLLWPLLGGMLLLPTALAEAYTLYGYEDEYGIVQLGEEPRDPRYVLIYEGPTDPKLGFAAIKKRLHELGGVSKTRNEDWIRDATRDYMRGIIPANDADYGSVRQLVEKLGLDALAEDE